MKTFGNIKSLGKDVELERNVLICYPHKGELKAKNTQIELKKFDVECDLIEIRFHNPEQYMNQKFCEGINGCSHIIIIITASALDLIWWNIENFNVLIDHAQNTSKYIIIYYASDLTKSDLPESIQDLKTLSTLKSLISYFKKILRK
jgi:hypothetical protein